MYTFELTMIDMETDKEKIVPIYVDENVCDDITEKDVYMCAMSIAFDTCKKYGDNYMFANIAFISC